ncbi:MAG: hypothetical protein J5J00_11180 [Deltaproteobacteria bacterium]|nr:hypothetical protein [Deltaproteobacteria bacterium]
MELNLALLLAVMMIFGAVVSVITGTTFGRGFSNFVIRRSEKPAEFWFTVSINFIFGIAAVVIVLSRS